MYFSSLCKTAFYLARQLLDRFSTNSYLSKPLDFFSRQILLHLRSIELSGICLDSFSTDSWSIEKVSVWLIVVRFVEVFLSSTNSQQHLNIFYLSRFSTRNQFSLFHISLDRKAISLPPNTLFSLKTPYPREFWPCPRSNHLVSVLNPLLFTHFTHLDLSFGFSWNFWVFLKTFEILVNFWVGFCLFGIIWSCIAFHVHFHNVSYI